MIFPLVAAALLTVATLPLVLLLSIVRAVRRKPQKTLWRRALGLHAVLFVVHLFVTFPATLGWIGSRWIGTRPPDRTYEGPRLDRDGRLLVQSTASLVREREQGHAVDPEIVAAARARVRYTTSRDGVRLRLFRLEAPKAEPEAVVVLAHGLFRCAVELEPVAGMLHDLGCECWLLDLRNHGGSGRAPFTGGLGESDDVVAAVRYVRAQPGRSGAPLLLYGVSLGTVAVSLALPRIDGVAGVILDSPIDDLHAAAHRMLGFERPGDRRSWLRLDEPWRSLVIAALGRWSGFRLEDVAPFEVLSSLPHDLPVLLIGGGIDDRAPPETVERLFANLPMPRALRELWIEPGGGHGNLAVEHPQRYASRLAWMMAHVRKP